MSTIHKIQQILKEIKFLQEFRRDEDEKNIFSFIGQPVIKGKMGTDHLARIIFFNILGFIDYGFIEKGYWHTFFSYKGKNFSIEDGKFGWSVYAQKGETRDSRTIKKLENNLFKAIAELDKKFHGTAKEEGLDYYLVNNYKKLWSYYSFYEKELQENIDAIRNQREDDKIVRDKEGNIILLTDEEMSISKRCLPLVISFFSILDFLLISFFAFETLSIDVAKIKSFKKKTKRNWEEGFKNVFDVENGEIKNIFRHIKKIKESYRNPLTHGLCDDPAFVVSLPRFGLVPQSFKQLDEKTYYGIIEFSPEDATKILGRFEKFINFIEKKKPYKLYLIYLKSGLPIPLNGKSMKELKKKMTNSKRIRQYIEEEKNREDIYANRDFSP